jgi:ATP-dependent helicase HrpB
MVSSTCAEHTPRRPIRPLALHQPLPIDALLPQLESAAQQEGSTVLLLAPPGAGKTTRVPLALLRCLAPTAATPSPPSPSSPAPASGKAQAADGNRRIWMLEPRRLAAKAAAERLAAELDESVGATVGYSVRLESRTSGATRLEVLTTGLFLRRLQADPALEGVAALILDEFHERGAELDLALALVRQARELLRPDLRLVVMSATLNLEPLRRQLPRARVLQSEGRSHPVTVEHQPPRPDERLERQVLRALEQHWLPRPEERVNGRGTALVFLPGLREINQCQRLMGSAAWASDIECVALHGNLALKQQSQAIQAARGPGGKVVLATAIAESSLTIEGVELVIDSGLSRANRFDPRSGMDGLITRPASLASAEQRAGRAGRLGPGRCVRLWSPAEQARRPAFDPPELLEADPVPIALQLAQWGDPLGEQLPWLDPPRSAALLEARQLLEQLGALDADGFLTSHGHQLARLGLHPRLGHLLLVGAGLGAAPLAAELAVLLSERDPLDRREVGCDLLRRLDWLRRQPRGSVLQRLRQQWLDQLERAPGPPPPTPAAAAAGAGAEAELAAELVAAAYPERVALVRAEQPQRFLMRGGRGALLPPHDPLLGSEALAIASVDGLGQEARILLALPLSRAGLRSEAERQGQWRQQARWDSQAGRVRCEETLELGALVLERRPWRGAGGEAVRVALLEGLRERGLEVLPWSAASRQLQARLQLLHSHLGAPWPQRDNDSLLKDLDQWLSPHLDSIQSLTDLQGLNLVEALWGELPWALRSELERLLPARLTLPGGKPAALDYGSGEPVLAVKLQSLFGMECTPTVLEGRLPVTVHLLTPAGRPAAITQDLAGFWRGSYRDVRRELRGRYPKHAWPEHPCTG